MKRLVGNGLALLRGRLQRQPALTKEHGAKERCHRPAAVALRLHCLGFGVFACFRLAESVHTHMPEVGFLPAVRGIVPITWLAALVGVWWWRRAGAYALTYLAAAGLLVIAPEHALPLFNLQLLMHLTAFGLPLIFIYRTWDMFD